MTGDPILVAVKEHALARNRNEVNQLADIDVEVADPVLERSQTAPEMVTTVGGGLPGGGLTAAVIEALGGPSFADGALGLQLVSGTANLPEPLLTFRAIDALLSSRRLEPPAFRVVVEGQEVNHQEYLVDTVTRRNVAYRRIDGARLAALARAGATFVLDDVDEMDPTIGDLVRGLQWWLGVSLRANLYVTSAGGQGYRPHWDDHEVIVLHVAGRKEWTVYRPRRSHPLPRDREFDLTYDPLPVWQGVLGPGAVLHIPRGWWHVARALDEPTIHVTLGCNLPTVIDLLRWAADEALEHPFKRQNLPRGGLPPDELELAIAGAAEVVRRLGNQGDALVQLSTEFPRRPSLELSRALGVATEWRCRTPFRPTVKERPGFVEVTAAGVTVVLAERGRPIVDSLCRGAWTAVANESLPGCDPSQVRLVHDTLSSLGWTEWR